MLNVKGLFTFIGYEIKPSEKVKMKSVRLVEYEQKKFSCQSKVSWASRRRDHRITENFGLERTFEGHLILCPLQWMVIILCVSGKNHLP